MLLSGVFSTTFRNASHNKITPVYVPCCLHSMHPREDMVYLGVGGFWN